MKNFWRYTFPGFFGMLIYISIRLVTDTPSDEQFWDRSARQNFIEISFSLLIAYLVDGLLRYSIRRFNDRKGKFNFGSVVGEFGFVLLLCLLVINPGILFIHYLARDPMDWADFTIANIIVGLYVLLYYAIARGNSLLKTYIEQQTQIERLKNDQLQTELKFLKAQYHPHFLFNALNTIYFQMDENIPAAKQTVEKFSQLLRYQLYDQHQQVPVRQELDHLKNFISLQKERTSGKLKLQLYFDEQLKEQKIFPLLMLPLVENAFKYVGGDYDVFIEARKINDGICFMVKNSVPESIPLNGGGIGLENLQRRLELLYPGRHELSLKNSNGQFQATLKLQVS